VNNLEDDTEQLQFPFLQPEKTYLDNKMQNAIGLIETKGLLALVEATDAMVKAASVSIVKRVDIGGGLVTTVVSGDVGSVRAAVEAGASAASQVGDLVGSHIIPRPAEGLDTAFFA
jgi:ethanolamine utilization protein EutM